MRSLPVALLSTLVACHGGGGATTTSTPPSTTTDTSTVTDTGTLPTNPTPTDTAPTDTARTDTGDPGPTSCAEGEEALAPGNFSLMWAAPTGEAVGLGTLGSAARTAAGTWTVDPDLHRPWTPRHVDGASIDEVWASNRNHVWRRDPATGMWSDMGFPGEPTYIVGLSVEAPDDVLVITADIQLDTGYLGSGVLTLHAYDGSSWSAETLPVDQAILQADRLPDGRVVALGNDRLEIQNGLSMDPLPVPAGFWAFDLQVAENGAILAMGTEVAIGDAAGLSLATPEPAGTTWRLGAIGELEDVWLVGWGSSPDAVVTHWDGTAWTHQTVPDSLQLTQIAATSSEVLLSDVGPTGHRVRTWDTTSFDTEHEPSFLEPLVVLATDDVTGEIWNFGQSGVTTFDGARWVTGTHPLGGLEWGGQVALSGGHGVLAGHASLYFTDGVDVSEERIGADDALTAVAAASGTVFAFGERWRGSLIEGHFGLANDGTGWVPVDLSGLPATANLESAWADAPDDLWIGIGSATGGALVHHDGTTATVVDASLPAAPTWMKRAADGSLWLSLSDLSGGGHGLYVWDGTTMSSVPDLPDDVRSVYELSDGTTFLTTLGTTAAGEDLAQILRSGPKGWEVATEGLDLTRLAGHGDTVVAGRHAGVVGWSHTCSP